MTDQQYAPPPPEYHYGPPPQKKGLGIAAMVLGIVAIVLSFIPVVGMLSFILGPLAVVLGIVAFVKQWGRGQAITGIITGALGTVIVFIGFMLFGAMMADFEEAMGGDQTIERSEDEDSAEDEGASAEQGADTDEEEGSAEAFIEDEEDVEPESDTTYSVGETATIVDSSTGDELYRLTMNEITPNFQCTDDLWRDEVEPETGAFLGIDVTVEATEDSEGGFELWHENFHIIDSAGEIRDFGWSSMDEDMCVATSDEIQDVRPGTNTTGKLAFDTAVESGTLVFEGAGGEIRWEF